ncbi:TPA: hypothetical protein ACH3X2_005018 [Trebouxia sp. C0005]
MAPKAEQKPGQSVAQLSTAEDETKLFAAVVDLDLVQVRQLLSQGVSANAKMVQSRDVAGCHLQRGSTPLHEAAAAGHQGIVDALLASQANLAIRDSVRSMPLDRAIAAGQLQMVRYCLSKQNLPEIDGQNLGWPSLSAACNIGDLQKCKDMMEELLAAGACINGMSFNGATCLHTAASCDNVMAVKWLLLHGADLAAQDKHGWTSLHCAIFKGSAQSARALLAHGADPNLVFPKSKDLAPQGSLLYESANEGHLMCVKALLASGASTAFQFKGKHPVETAIVRGRWGIVEAFLSHYKEHPPPADSRECNFGKLLSGTIHAGKSHIVQRFLSCTGLPDQLGLDDMLSDFFLHDFILNELPTFKALLPHCKKQDPSQLVGRSFCMHL